MPLFNFGITISSGFNFNFGTTYTGTEIIFNFIEEGYGYNDYDFNFGAPGVKQLVIKSTATPDYFINSINVENFGGDDVLYVNTISGIVRVFSSSYSGTIDDRNIVDSDYASGNCAAEIIWAGTGNKVIELNTASGTSEEFLLNGDVSCLLYYMY
jgi:hypothetical protein